MSIFSKTVMALLLFFISNSAPLISNAGTLTTDTTSYVLNKLESHDIVFLGTTHQQPRILSFLSNLIHTHTLHKVGVTHICLEIPSDQQNKLDRFINSGQSLSKIKLWSAVDCPEYRNFLKTIRILPTDNALSPLAIDLPRSRFKEEEISRNEYMAKRIAELYDEPASKKILVVLGNLHVLKKLNWEDHVPHKHPSIYEYLSKKHQEIEMFSIAQIIDNRPKTCDFTKNFAPIDGTVALDITEQFLDWKLGELSVIAVKETLPHEAFGGLIIY